MVKDHIFIVFGAEHYNRATCSPLKRWRTALFQSVL